MRRLLYLLRVKLFGVSGSKPIFLGQSLNGVPVMFGKGVQEREAALDVLARHKLHARQYHPAIGIGDPDLRQAMTLLAHQGYIFTDETGGMVGAVGLPARPTSDEVAQLRRSALHVVSSVDG
jgi:hypothetical protein